MTFQLCSLKLWPLVKVNGVNMESVKELAIQFFQDSVDKAKRTLSHVPTDKLTWKPSPTSKSSLEVAAHIGVANMGLAKMIENRGAIPMSIDELFAAIKSEEAKLTSLDSVLSLLDSSAEYMSKVLKEIPASELESGSIDTPFGTRPLKRFIFVPESHTNGHVSQLDYLQTVWGDLVPH